MRRPGMYCMGHRPIMGHHPIFTMGHLPRPMGHLPRPMDHLPRPMGHHRPMITTGFSIVGPFTRQRRRGAPGDIRSSQLCSQHMAGVLPPVAVELATEQAPPAPQQQQ
ncbi:uncharacterized protein LOC107263542 isoform X1 [Cephus cinctus]|uniref:Uncharacterized protein LOC107263542 isoform X1 n=1 Tax=Cephus cinctus TaxID=211228 RepID=A0AAJ7VXE7_CEPCN|nr:uncharacterized protein LOC107263542 isoform X1 [Cephus cinctus]XP_024936651.1 uncharacterized protein LOC107263542 isoform X1 [Cephus cinctus]XP_024936652.1 uncharacterized protein LOC107263542 isoform X1 [Cephus cinctus]